MRNKTHFNNTLLSALNMSLSSQNSSWLFIADDGGYIEVDRRTITKTRIASATSKS